jgi:hypothetical protein
MTHEHKEHLRRKMYAIARSEGASVSEAQRVSQEPWRWLNADGTRIPWSRAPRVAPPAWWTESREWEEEETPESEDGYDDSAFESNPARTVDELPDDVTVGVVEDFDEVENRIVSFTVYYADTEGHPLPSSRDSITDPRPERFFSGAVRVENKPLCEAFEVVYAIAAPGWGPLLYDVALELASEYGGGLMSDRWSLSDDACRVWMHYLKHRPDVQHRPLQWTTPADPDRPSSEWLWRQRCTPAHTSCGAAPWYVFSKAPTTLQQLERAGKILYFDDRPPGWSYEGQLVHPPEADESMATPKPLAANPK